MVAIDPHRLVARVLTRPAPPAEELDRRLALLEACWATFDATAARVSADLRPGPRGGGRSRDEIVRHVHASESHNFSAKVGVRTGLAVMLTRDGLAEHRRSVDDTIRAFNAEGRTARSWPIQFLVRLTAHHVMDHAWEMEDRDLTA